ncbi:MAG: large repetitive protein, partial [Thermoleophilaceae bacterium]|nr:large repetitive protein [Thermoleophilaceae bacterium]
MTVARVPGRFALAVGAVVLALFLVPAAARAGTYDVVACDAAPGGASGSWTGMASALMSTGAKCPTGLAEQNGIRAGARVDAGTAPPFSYATQSFDAPDGASIVSLEAQFMLHRKANYWSVGIFADGRMILGCPPNDANDLCLWSTAWPGTSRSFSFPQGVHRVYAQTACGGANGCATGPPDSAPYYDRASIRLYSATVRVRDDSTPAVTDLGDGRLTDGTWQAGSRAIGYAASDNVGIRSTRLYVDGRQRDDLQHSCDFTRRIPCADVGRARYTIDTQALTDGPHELRLEATDTAGNVGALVRSFNSDNTPPDAPEEVTVDGGEGWRAVNGFRLAWENTDSAAPIAAVHYELCDTTAGGCVQGERRAEGAASIDDLRVPEPGDYTVRLWLEDAAGNFNDGNRSPAVHLRFDDVPPGRGEPAPRERWTNAAEIDEPIAMGEGQIVPVSGIGGYSVTVDGSDPDATVDVRGNSYPLARLPQGATRVRARAVSGAGVPSPFVGEATIRVDRTPPVTAAPGAPDPGAWQSQPVVLTLRGADQAELAGMDPAPAGEPTESGGYIEYRVDGADPERVRGEAAAVTLEEDGGHVVSFHAVDAAGNASPERTVRVRIDRTPPELVVFEATDRVDPRAIRVAAADSTSGIASGAIQIRRAGSGDGWRALPTRRHGSRFVAQFDDDRLTGLWELRATVVDRAGNRAVGDRRRGGSPALVDAGSLRGTTRLSAGIVQAHASSRAQPLTAATVGFGRRAQARGSLLRAGGTPVAGAVVEVWSRPAMAGAAARLVRRVRTSSTGGFAYPAPAGTSRTLHFRYAGSAALRPAASNVTVRVPAAITIGPDRHSARNGQAVTFSGRLRSRPIPAAGNVIDLQAFNRGRWRTVATPRAASGGRWHYRYRFGATRGRLVYRFRVLVRPEA